MKKYKDCSNYFFKKAIEKINALHESDYILGYQKNIFDSILQNYFIKYRNRKSINIFLHSIKKEFLFESAILKFENEDYLKIYNIANGIFFCGLGRDNSNNNINEQIHLPNKIELELIEFLIKLYQINYNVRNISGFALNEKLDIDRINLEIKIFEKFQNRFMLRGKIFNLPGFRKEILNRVKSVIEKISRYSILTFIYKLIYERYYDSKLNYFVSKSDLIEGGIVYFYHLCLSLSPETGEEFKCDDFVIIMDDIILILDSYPYKRDSQFDGMFMHDPSNYLVRIMKHDLIYCFNQYNPDAIIYLTSKIFRNDVKNLSMKAFCFYILNNPFYSFRFINPNNLTITREIFYNYINSIPSNEKNNICDRLGIELPSNISRSFCDKFLEEYSGKIIKSQKLLPHNIRSPINNIAPLILREDSSFPYLKYLCGNFTANHFFEKNYKDTNWRNIGKDFELAFYDLLAKFPNTIYYKPNIRHITCCLILQPMDSLLSPVVTGNLIQLFLNYEFLLDQELGKSQEVYEIQKEFKELSQKFYTMLDAKGKENWIQMLISSVKFVSFEEIYLFVRHAKSYKEFIKLFSGAFYSQPSNYRLYNKVREAIDLFEYRKNGKTKN